MQDAIEALAIGFSLFLVFGTVAVFVILMRYIAYKEKQALEQLDTHKEVSHE